MLWAKDVNGDQTPIIAFNIAVTETIGSFDSLTFNFMVNISDASDPNKIASEMMVPGTKITEPETGKVFRLLSFNPTSMGEYQQYAVTCVSIGYELHDHYVESKLSNTQTLKACLDLITSGTNFTYQITGSFSNYSFSEGFGGGYADDLLTQIASDFGFEFYFDNYVIHVMAQIGKSDAFLFVENANCAKISFQEDYSTLTTHIKGYGKQNDDGSYTATAEYTSSTASMWGKIDAEPYQSDSITNYDTLLAKLKSQIHDYPDVQYTMDFVDFKNSLQGFSNNTTAGNYGYIRSRFGIDVNVRVQSRTYFPQDTKNAGTITFGNKIFDPVTYQNKMNAAFQNNYKMGTSNQKKLIVLNDGYQNLQNEVNLLRSNVNLLQSDGIFINVSSDNADTTETWFKKLVSFGAKGLLVKLTEGETYINPVATAQITNGVTAGLNLVGCYHYFLGSGTAEGEYFLSQLKAKEIPQSSLVVLDVEDSVLTTDTTIMNAQITDFFKVLTDAGYTNTCLCANEDWFDKRFSSNLALYKWALATNDSTRPPSYDAWKFTNSWNGENVDANYGYNSLFV
ncbi:phage tail protein [Liquorilactobacillus sp.]|uniref:phage tail protein n=1 Tax=Liquorilactobacillus sp. TaxID=2767923 RepID=UPI0039EB492F